MSTRLTYQDESNEQLLSSKSQSSETEERDTEDHDESLASLLGINSKDIVDLDEDVSYIDGQENVTSCENEEGHNDDGADDNVTDGDTETENLSTASKDIQERESPVEKKFDFAKIFGTDLDKAEKERKQKSSSDDQNTEKEDENELFELSESKISLLLLPASKVDSDKSEPKHERNVDKKKEMFMKIMRRENSQTGKIVCGIVFIVIMICITLGLLALGWWYHVMDLYLIGAIFGGGTVVFVIIFVFIRCTAVTGNTDYKMLYRTDSRPGK